MLFDSPSDGDEALCDGYRRRESMFVAGELLVAYYVIGPAKHFCVMSESAALCYNTGRKYAKERIS